MGLNVGLLLPADEQNTTSQAVLADIHAASQRLEPYCRIERLAAAWREIPAAASSPSVGYAGVVVQLLLGVPGKVLEELDNAEREYCRNRTRSVRTFSASRKESWNASSARCV